MAQSTLIPPADAGIDSDYLDRQAAALERQAPLDVLRWAAGRFAPRLTFATGFGPEGCVLIDLIGCHRLPVDIFTLDTELLFPATRELWGRLEQRYGITIRGVRPALTVAGQAAAHGVAIDARNADSFEEAQGVHRPGVVDATFEHDVDIGLLPEIEYELPVVDEDDVDAGPASELLDEKLLFRPDQRMEESDPHSPQSSSTSGASPRRGGSTSSTSSSLPQSGHSISSPSTVSPASSTSPPQTGHSAMAFISSFKSGLFTESSRNAREPDSKLHRFAGNRVATTSCAPR